MSTTTRLFAGSVLTALLLIPAVPAHSAPANTVAPANIAAEHEFSFANKPKKTVTVKCYLMNLQNEATGEVVYGTGKDRAAAQADANSKVPRGHKLKHCDLVR
ncbi:hypothetical protein [Nocardia barduliensis]|uniref:hypothetical protein n=1 Tax=Nocardia barduliensis TaxID=2736643 RepID=UPI001573007A|nr:hypothetical protein [Nocardia barduliensis]